MQERFGKMLKRLIPLGAVLASFLFARQTNAQTTPQEVSFCDLAKNPQAFDGKTIRVRGAMSVYFEDFTLVSRDCEARHGIWMAFGGDVPGVVTSTVNDNFRTPGVDLTVNGVAYKIKKDEDFRRLYALIAARHGDKPVYRVTATLTGAFFAGKEEKLSSGQLFFEGYGHLGCCALLVITEVADVESVPPANLNVRGTLFGPDGKPLAGFIVIDDVAGGSPPERERTTTDERGNFAFSDSRMLLRFRDPRYRPLALAVTPGGAPVQVRLEDAKRSDWIVPSCGPAEASVRRIGFSALFTLPPGMDSSPFNNEGTRSYFVFPKGDDSTSAELIISTDPARAADEALDFEPGRQRWIKDGSGTVIGVDAHGRRWRGASFLGRDYVGYRLRSGERIRLLDQMIDSVCMAKQ